MIIVPFLGISQISKINTAAGEQPLFSETK